MNRTNSRRYSILATLVMIAVGLLASASPRTGGSVSHTNRARPHDDNDPEKYLFVWAGDQARQRPDFLAVVNFNENSRNYGRVLTTVPLPGAGATGNEPHHVGLSRDGRVLACGGLLSVLKGQKEIFFFDVSKPESPSFISSADPPLLVLDPRFQLDFNTAFSAPARPHGLAFK